MILFRTCSSKSISPALRFVKRTNNIQAVAKFIGATEMIDEIFSRPLPIEKKYESRFGPEGLNRNILYASEKKETTLYEYGYHLLLEPTFQGRAINANTYALDLVSQGAPLDVSEQPNFNRLLSRISYQEAHRWLREIDENSLDVIKYPNVRDRNPGGANFAIFKKESIGASNTMAVPESLILIPRNGGSVDVQRQSDSTYTIMPLMN